jgi:hypothetical protein
MGRIIKEFVLIADRGRVPVPVLMDSGASASVLRKDVALKIGTPQKLVKPVIFGSARRGIRLKAEAALFVQVVVNGKILDGPFYVSSDLSREAVIGADFMQKWDIRLQPRAHRFTVGIDPQHLEIF